MRAYRTSMKGLHSAVRVALAGTYEVEKLFHSSVCVCELALRAGRVIRSM